MLLDLRRYGVAAAVEMVVAALFFLMVVMVATGGTFDPAEDLGGLVFLLVLAVVSGTAALLAFRARDDARFRLAFVIVELLWVGCCVLLLVGTQPHHADASSLMEATQGGDALVRLTFALGAAAAEAGAAVARRFIEILMAPHVVCLALGLWGLVDGSCNTARDL